MIRIKRLISQSSNHVTFSSTIDSKWQTGKIDPYFRLFATLNQMKGLTFYFFEDYKKKAIATEEIGNQIGAQFAKGWDQSKGFEGLHLDLFGQYKLCHLT